MTTSHFKRWIDRLNFSNILILWILIIMLFGLLYFVLQADGSYLHNVSEGKPVEHLKDAVYFSFVTATTTGFGDILPKGMFKLLAIIEVIFGMLLLALVTSKLVSIKQDVILNELYDLSFNEKVQKLRSSLMLFRQNLDKLIAKIEEGALPKRELNAIALYFQSLEDALNELFLILKKSDGHYFVKQIDIVNKEILLNSLLSSWEKGAETFSVLNSKGISWKSDNLSAVINRCVAATEHLFSNPAFTGSIRTEMLKDAQKKKESLLSQVTTEVNSVSLEKP